MSSNNIQSSTRAYPIAKSYSKADEEKILF